MRWRLFAIVLPVLATLVGCGEGYRIEPARLNILAVTPEAFPDAATTVHDIMMREGFEDLGKYTDMIALINHDTAMPSSAKRQELVRLEREYTYLNERRHLRVVLSNYTDGVPPEISLDYPRVSDHFIEVAVYDERPGGFGSYGLGFYERLIAALKKRFGPSVRIVEPPPPTNDAEYRRITTENTIGATIAWCLAFALPLLVTGSLSRYLLQKFTISKGLKRLIFVVINTWLVTPLPFPAATILVILLPNIFAFPWTSTDYYSQVSSFAAVSFPVTFLLCAIISLFLFSAKAEAESCEAPA